MVVLFCSVLVLKPFELCGDTLVRPRESSCSKEHAPGGNSTRIAKPEQIQSVEFFRYYGTVVVYTVSQYA